jgi:hypothetical protein
MQSPVFVSTRSQNSQYLICADLLDRDVANPLKALMNRLSPLFYVNSVRPLRAVRFEIFIGDLAECFRAAAARLAARLVSNGSTGLGGLLTGFGKAHVEGGPEAHFMLAASELVKNVHFLPPVLST